MSRLLRNYLSVVFVRGHPKPASDGHLKTGHL